MRLAAHHPWLILPVVLAALIEAIWRLRSGRGYDGREAAASLGVALGQLLLRPLNLFVTSAILMQVHRLSPWSIPTNDWRWWIVGFLAVEFAYYGFHRASHRIRWMWATHAVHHSAHSIVLPSAIRLGWTEALSMGWLFFVPLALIGFPPQMLGVLLALNLLYQYPLHTEAIRRLGPLEWIFNTPSHHRAHHSSDAPYLDCNFGGTLIVFDRLFGSFRAEPVEGGLHYGLVHPVSSRNPFMIALGEWRSLFCDLGMTTGFRAKLGLMLGSPD